MKRIIWIIVLVFTSLGLARGDAGEVTTYVQYKTGSPITLHLNYYGGIREWDAGASIANGKLILSNAMFISITNSKNEPVKPIKDKVLSVWADQYFRNPFTLVLDISRFYDLSQPDKYIVRWGCRDVKFNRVFIKIVD